MKFSVITVCKNSGSVLEHTIKSVLEQTGADFEYLIIDGGSTDRTLKILKKYQPDIDYCVSEPDFGIYDAMNKAITRSKGDWLYFLNAGDSFLNNSVLAHVSQVTGSHDLIYGNVIMDMGERKIINSPQNISRFLLLQKTICHQAIFARRQLFIRWGKFETKYKIAADYEWLLRMIFGQQTKQVYYDINISLVDMSGVSNSLQMRPSTLKEYDEIRHKYFTQAEIDVFHLYGKIVSLLTTIKKGMGL
jgi:glycosyltransferase involved in cell wall biosynthesis